MKFLKCISHKPTSPKSNVTVRKLKKSKSKRSKKKKGVVKSHERKRNRNSYISSSINRNFYPSEQFPRRSYSSHDIIEAFDSPSNDTYVYNYNLETGRRTRSEPEIRAETAYADYLRYYQKQILELQMQNQARMKNFVNTPIICDTNNNNQQTNDYGFVSNSHQNIDNYYNLNYSKQQQKQQQQHVDESNNRMMMYQMPFQHNLLKQQSIVPHYNTSVRILNNNRLGNDLSYLNGEEYHPYPNNSVFPTQIVKQQQIPTQLLHSRRNSSGSATRFSYPQCLSQFKKGFFLSSETFGKKIHKSHDKRKHSHHKRSRSKVFKHFFFLLIFVTTQSCEFSVIYITIYKSIHIKLCRNIVVI